MGLPTQRILRPACAYVPHQRNGAQLRTQARQLREERARGAGLQRGLAKAVYTAERERAVARAAAAKEM